jgi:hypothetical protein
MFLASNTRSFAQVEGNLYWEEAMNEEYNSLIENHTWDLVSLPSNLKLVRCKWIYKKKKVADKLVSRYKDQLVAKGFQQVHGIDYNETFAPVAKMDSNRFALAIATTRKWHVHHMDVKNSFIHGDLKEEI